MDLYEILGILRDASPEEIKLAYKNKCMSAHPDKGGSAEEFNKVKKAYDTLKDINKRNYYNKYGELDPDGTEEIAVQRLMKALFHSNVEDHLIVPYSNLKGHLQTITTKSQIMSNDIAKLKSDIESLKDNEDVYLIFNRLKGLLIEREQMFLALERERILCESILTEFSVVESVLGRSFLSELIKAQRGY